MRRASLLLLAGALAVLVLAPLAGALEECDDCLAGGAEGCCPPACALCLCCAAAPSMVASGLVSRPDLAAGVAVRLATVRRGPAPDLAGILHVPLFA